MGIKDGDRFVREGGQLIRAQSQRFALVSLDGQVSGGSGRRRVFHLLRTTEGKRERRGTKDGHSKELFKRHYTILGQSCNFHLVGPSQFRETCMFNSFSMRTTLMTLVMAFVACTGCTAATKTPIPAPAGDSPLAQTKGRETAIFAGGCFWG